MGSVNMRSVVTVPVATWKSRRRRRTVAGNRNGNVTMEGNLQTRLLTQFSWPQVAFCNCDMIVTFSGTEGGVIRRSRGENTV